jgi:uncharacterized protein (TIGR04255 family)
LSSTKLKNAPLREVILELHWECIADSTGFFSDLGYDLAQGKLALELKEEFPLHRKLIPEGIKVFGVPMHQYWTGEFKWPVIQHGQGMLTINEVGVNYEWNIFKSLIDKTLDRVIRSYEGVIKFNNVKLQYIDAFDIGNEIDPLEFVKQNLQTEITTKYNLPGSPKSFNIQQGFEILDGATMILNIANAVNNENQNLSIICTTTVEFNGQLEQKLIREWVDKAHTSTSNMFKDMLNPEFYASLDK